MKLVTTALEWSYVDGQNDVSPRHLEAAAEQLTLRRDEIHIVDAIGKSGEDTGSAGAETLEAKKANPK